jgi:hypothetical protein
MTEHVFIILAGIPDKVYDHIYQQPPYKLGSGDCHIVVSPLRPTGDGSYRYQNSHLDSLMEKLYVDFVPRAKADLGSEMYVFLVYLEYDRASTLECISRFCPFALCYKIPPAHGVFGHGKGFYRSRNELVVRIKESTKRLRQKVGIIKHEINSHRSTTPFLLPVVNFSSDTLRGLLTEAAISIPFGLDVGEMLERMKAKFDGRHGRAMVGERRYYADQRGLVFKAPPDRFLHGQNLRGNTVHGGKGHLELCTIMGRTRLGAPYKPSFHYDCELGGHQRISREFSGCHGQAVDARNWTHANIAPNDWVG